jgi:hypothetical protein
MITFEQLTQGFEGSEKKKQFFLELEKIEEKYSAFFSGRKSKFDPDKPDKLKYHLYFDLTNTEITNSGLTDDDLPNYIIDEVVNSFKSIFLKAK